MIKKALVYMMLLVFVGQLTACGSNLSSLESLPTSPTTEIQGELPMQETTSAIIEVDESLLTVEITFPAELVAEEGDTGNFDVDAYVAEGGFLSAVVNDDGTLTVTMTKARHQEIHAEAIAELDVILAEMVESVDTPYIKEITYTDDFSLFEMKVVRSEYENSFDMTPFSLGFYGVLYQMFFEPGMEYHCEVSVIDVDTNEILNTIVYPDVLEDFR